MNVQTTKNEIKEYFEAWRDVYKDARLSRGDLAIMYTMQDQAYTEIWFSNQTFAARTGMTKRNVIKVMKHLVNLGYLIKIPGKHKRATNHYVVKDALQSPFKDYSEVKQLIARYFENTNPGEVQFTSQEKVVNSRSPGGEPQFTSTSEAEFTLTYKDTNEQNQRQRDEGASLSGLRPEKIMSRENQKIQKDDFGQLEPILPISNTVVNADRDPIIRGLKAKIPYWEYAKEHHIAWDEIVRKHQEASDSWKEGTRYNAKDIFDLTKKFVKQDLVKKLIEPLEGEMVEWEDMLIDAYDPNIKISEREHWLKKYGHLSEKEYEQHFAQWKQNLEDAQNRIREDSRN